MAKNKEKTEALRLRSLGYSYSQIKRAVKVSKSTLSNWLEKYPLPDARIRELRDWNAARIEHYIATRKRNRENLLKEIYGQERTKILPFSEKEIFLCGLFLYLGEGGKTKPFEISLSNTDPMVIKFFIYWVVNILKVPKKKLKIRLHLYRDMDILKETRFWHKELGIVFSQFQKPYIKESAFSTLTYKRGFGHGTCNVILCDGAIAKKVFMGLRVIRDFFR